MPLRLLEAVVPSSADVRGLLSESPVIDIWNPPTDGERAVVRILLEAGHTERVSDVLTQAFGSLDEFRLVVLTVEATIPPVPASESESTADDERAGTASAIAAPLGRISREELYEDVAQAA
jgi:hypothetical protein